MKRPKYSVVQSKWHQSTLTESWLSKNANRENQSNKNVVDIKLKSPLKSTENHNQLQNSKLNLNEKNNLFDAEENESDDNDIVASSQSANQSKLRKKIGENLSKRSITARQSPQKVQNELTPNLSEQKLSISDICNSSLIKDELITDMYDNIVNFEPIEMSHDLSSLLADPNLMSNILLTSPSIDTEKAEPQLEADSMHDPLQIDENDRIEYLNRSSPRKRTRSSSGEKSFPKKVCYSSGNEEKDTSKRNSKLKKNRNENVLSHDLEKKLKFLRVKLQHEVPPQHKIENNAGSRPLSEEQAKEFETYGPLKRGTYSKREDEIIKNNWKEFCEIHEWDENIVFPFLNMRHKGKYYIPELFERRKFVRFLANGLPWRSLYSVYFRFRNLFDVKIGSGQYTSKEDKIIINYMRNTSNAVNVNQCAEIANILKRKKQSVWHRIKTLKKIHDFTKSDSSDYESDDSKKLKKKKKKINSSKNKKSYSTNLSDSENDENEKLMKKEKKKIQTKSKNKKKKCNMKFRMRLDQKVCTNVKWTSPLVNKFIENLINITVSDKVQDLKNKKIDESDWIKVEKIIKIDHTILQNFWNCQLHLQLFSPTPIYLNDIKMKLIEYMFDNKEKNLEDILWEDVCLSFDGITTDFLSKLFDHLIQHAQNKIDSNNLKDIVQYLYEHHIPELEDKTIDVILPKLYYKGGRIICMDKGTEKKILNRITSDPLAEKDE